MARNASDVIASLEPDRRRRIEGRATALIAEEMSHQPMRYVDGRTLRATGRTVQFTTRITSDLQAEIKLFAAQHGLQINELLEQAFAALKREVQK